MRYRHIKLARRGAALQLRFKAALFFVFAFFALFSFERFLLFCFNYSFFEKLSFWQTFTAFLSGLRFDFSAIALFVFPLIFMMILPVKSRKWLKMWTFALCAEFVLSGALLTADLIYFGYVKRHMGEELLSLGNDFSFIVGYAFGPGLWILLLLIFAFAFFIWLVNTIINIYYDKPEFMGRKEIMFYFIFILLAAFGIYGKAGKTPLNIPDAYKNADTSMAADLALNGIFTSYSVISQGNYMAENERDINLATEETVKMLSSEREESPMPYQYPLMRKFKNAKPYKKPLNVVIVALESWVPNYIDSVNGTAYGVTPNFDKLVKYGSYFNNFYAFELRSLQGITAVLTGIPALPKMQKLGYGLQNTSMTKLPQILKNKGYRTIFAQTSQRSSFNLDKSAELLGFEEIYGMEDMPKQFNYAKAEGYGYDYDMYHLLAEKLRGRDEPFFIFAFTGITHTPYLGYLEGFDKYPNTTEENKYLNSLLFADYSIGYFIEEARKEPWFYDTVFIFVADHTFNRNGNIKEKYHIPFLIYAPKYVKAQKNDTLGSQLDILPTLFDLLRLQEPYSAAGKTLFAEDGERRALFADGYTIGLIKNDGAIRHTREKTLEEEKYEGTFDTTKAEEELLSLDKTVFTLIKEDRWYPSEEENAAKNSD
ncbi:LTA synthase family protein [Candidatus Proelusimicrobium excrementi]|uniref:LTA synthase family protein n=1 Tax=Candidatus Proelusimicrobium excrementi TaxID=3416222 RepID=UPI003D09F8A8